MKRRLITLFLCAITAAPLATLAMQPEGPGGPGGSRGGPGGSGHGGQMRDGHRMDRHIERLQERLKLSADQVEQIRAIMETGREEHQAIAARYGIDWQNPESRRSLDPNKKQEMREEMRKLRDEHQSKIAAVLNEQQLAEWKTMQKERRAWMKDRKNRKDKRFGKPSPDDSE